MSSSCCGLLISVADEMTGGDIVEVHIMSKIRQSCPDLIDK